MMKSKSSQGMNISSGQFSSEKWGKKNRGAKLAGSNSTNSSFFILACSWKESAKRRLVSTASLPLWILRSVGFGRKGASKNNNSGNANINFGGINPMSGKIRYRAETFSTLQLGEVGEEKDIGDFEDADDPLNHLSPDERQEYIASLTLKDGVRVLSETEANERERKKLEMAVDKKRLAEEMKAKNTPKQFKGPSQ